MRSIFGRIVNGEIPAAKLYEDDLTLAFLDISPAAKGHTLVICKEEYASIYELPPAVLVAVMHTTQRIAIALRAVLKPDGLNILQNNGEAAGQTVMHLHVHLIPRWRGDNAMLLWKPGSADSNDLSALATSISTHIPANS